MGIKNKDGTPYKLAGPNLLAKSQEFWKKDEIFILHNFNWDNALVELAKEIEIPVEIEPQVEESKPEARPEPRKDLKTTNVVMVHCLPIVDVEHEDVLYNQKYTTEGYGEKFTFEAIVISRGDMSLVFWTNINLRKNSVIFPSKYRDGVKYGEYRWWKVNKQEEKASGFLTESVPSSYQPDFT
jgi:hypothetical protein